MPISYPMPSHLQGPSAQEWGNLARAGQQLQMEQARLAQSAQASARDAAIRADIANKEHQIQLARINTENAYNEIRTRLRANEVANASKAVNLKAADMAQKARIASVPPAVVQLNGEDFLKVPTPSGFQYRQIRKTAGGGLTPAQRMTDLRSARNSLINNNRFAFDETSTEEEQGSENAKIALREFKKKLNEIDQQMEAIRKGQMLETITQPAAPQSEQPAPAKPSIKIKSVKRLSD